MYNRTQSQSLSHEDSKHRMDSLEQDAPMWTVLMPATVCIHQTSFQRLKATVLNCSDLDSFQHFVYQKVLFGGFCAMIVVY